MSTAPVATEVRTVHVAVIGTGFSGLGTAIGLRRAGIEDFVLLEKAGDVGGTWRENTYPGVECDVPSNVYSFSFAPNPDWSRSFSAGREIWDYLRRVARDFGVWDKIEFGTEVQAARWNPERRRWRIETSRGELEARYLVLGSGGLHVPKYPDLPGIETFAGTAFHSAEWDHEHDLAGKRVAVIGTGASAIQFIPAIQKQAARLHVFQRSAPWVMPRRNRRFSRLEHALYRALPPAQLLARAVVYWARETNVAFMMHPRLTPIPERISAAHLKRQVKDPVLRRKLTPDFMFACKRVLLSNDYYPAIAAPNVELVTEGIREVRPHSIVGADGVEREVDTIIYGTGFHVTDMPVAEAIVDGDGRSLAESFDGSPQAYRGTTFAGFPNLFMVLGPNTGLGHNSVVFMIESQVNYVVDAVRKLDAAGITAFEVRRERVERYNERLQKRLKGTVWTSGCASWYLDAKGRLSTIWPGGTWRFREQTRRFDEDAYELSPAVPEPQRAAA